MIYRAFLLLALALSADESHEDVKIRESIPFVGDFKPEPKVGSFVVVGHGMLIIVSKNDGKTWKQAFFATPGAGSWAVGDDTSSAAPMAAKAGRKS